MQRSILYWTADKLIFIAQTHFRVHVLWDQTVGVFTEVQLLTCAHLLDNPLENCNRLEISYVSTNMKNKKATSPGSCSTVVYFIKKTRVQI